MSAVCREQLNDLLDDLPEENLRALFDVLHRLGEQGRIRRWSSAIGSLSDNDADQMRRAVSEGCERVDDEDW